MAFTKPLTTSEIESNLVVPKELFGEVFSPMHGGGGGGGSEAANIFVRCEKGMTWTFRMSRIRARGSSRYKLVVSAGWLSFVRDRKLKSGDIVCIYRDCGSFGGDRTSFRIECKKASDHKTPLLDASLDHHQWTRLH